jgi:hypothetical protein
MSFDLVDGRHDGRGREEGFQAPDIEVGYADCASLARGEEGFHRFPRRGWADVVEGEDAFGIEREPFLSGLKCAEMNQLCHSIRARSRLRSKGLTKANASNINQHIQLPDPPKSYPKPSQRLPAGVWCSKACQ